MIGLPLDADEAKIQIFISTQSLSSGKITRCFYIYKWKVDEILFYILF